MKASIIVLAALLAQLGFSVPHRHRKHHLKKRDIVTDVYTVTDVVTVVAPDAVVWVDDNGNVVSTEYRDSTTTTLPLSTVNEMSTAAGYQVSATNTPPASPTPPAPVSSTPSVASAPVAPSNTPAPVQNQNQNADSSSNARVGSGYGVCYEMLDASSNCKSPATIDSDFGFLSSKGMNLVRVYDISCNVGQIVSAASKHGLKVFAGINNAMNVGSDLPKLVGMINGNWGPIDTINIGNENVNNGIASPGQVVGAIAQAKGILAAAGYTGNIVTVDTFNQLEAHPELCGASSYCAANTHAFFDPNTNAQGAGKFVSNAYSQIQAANGGKRVVITESGWPYQGSPNGAAIPSVQNQRDAISSIMQAFSNDPSNLFLFQAWDATYKQPGSMGVEQYFGLFDSDHYDGQL